MADPDPLEDAKLDAAMRLATLAGVIRPLTDLRDTRQTGGIVMSPEAVDAAGAQYARDRQMRAWSKAAGYPEAPTGSTTPTNLAVAACLIEIQLGLANWVTRIIRTQAAARVCLLPRATWATPRQDPIDLAWQLRDMVWQLRRRDWVEAITRNTQTWTDEARRLIEPPKQFTHRDPCPWCGRRSLVIYPEEDRITCVRNPDRHGHRPTCECPRPVCPCHDPHSNFTHEWTSDARRFDESWAGLANLLAVARKASATYHEEHTQ